MKTGTSLFLCLAGFFACISSSSQVIRSITELDGSLSITSKQLDVRINMSPWFISVYDIRGNLISGEQENGVFLFGNDRISDYAGHYETLGVDTLVKRDPPFYHLYDESVIIGETVEFDCNTLNGRKARVCLTFRNPWVFSVWITLPDVVEPVVHRFISDEKEHFFGLGECWETRSLDLKGLTVTMNNSTGTPDQGGYVPFYVSTRGYGILVDNYLRVSFDFSGPGSVGITAPAITGSADGSGYFNGTSFLYYFYYGPDLLDVISRFTEHVSRPALPPSWALFSTWQWRDVNTQQGVYDDAGGMRSRQIPCGLIFIDRPWAQGAQNMPPPFEWQASRYPDGSRMFRDLQQKGYKTGVWVARNLYGSFSDTANYTRLRDDTRGFLERDNCQMYKIDRGNVQSIDPLFTCQAYYEAWDDVFHGDFVTLPRTIANRAQQYVSGKWPGDNDNTYEYPSGLKANIATMLNLAIAGFPFSGGDTGGFPDPPGNNVTARWAQFSSFCTIFETAGRPYDYSDKYRDIYRRYAELYTSLFPYRWTYARLAHQHGYPVTRALALEFPDDPAGYSRKFEYLYGDWILVAPVVTSGTSREVYLPEGKWYDWWDGTAYGGPVTLEDYPAPEDRLPLFIRAGAIIPMIDAQQTWMDATTDPLSFRIYPEGESGFRILGDTVVYPHMEKPYTDLPDLEVKCARTDAEIRVETGEFSGTLVFEVHVGAAFQDVNRNGEGLNRLDDRAGFDAAGEGWYFEKGNGDIAWIKVRSDGTGPNEVLITLPAASARGNAIGSNSLSNTCVKPVSSGTGYKHEFTDFRYIP